MSQDHTKKDQEKESKPQIKTRGGNSGDSDSTTGSKSDKSVPAS